MTVGYMRNLGATKPLFNAVVNAGGALNALNLQARGREILDTGLNLMMQVSLQAKGRNAPAQDIAPVQRTTPTHS